MQGQHALDIDRRDVLAAADDHVVDAAGDEEIAVAIDIAGVAGEVPAVAQAFGVRIGPTVVALERLVAEQFGNDLALFAARSALLDRGAIQGDHAQSGVDAGASGRARLGDGALVDRHRVDLGTAVVVDEQIGFEGGLQTLQQGVVHRRASEAEFADGRDVGGREIGMRQQVVVQRRHEVEMADLLGCYGLQRGRGIEARHADKAAVEQGQGEQRAHAHRVIQRHHAQRAFAVAVLVLRHVGERGDALGAVAARHAFRCAGRARGVEHQRQVVGVGQRCWLVAAGHAVFKTQRAAVRFADGHARDAGGFGRLDNGLLGRRLEHQRRRVRIAQRVVDLVRLGAPVQRRHHDAFELAGPVERGGLSAVLQHGQQVLAAPQAQAAQAALGRADAQRPVAV